METMIELSPIFEYIIQILGTLLLALATWGMNTLRTKLNISKTNEVWRALDGEIDRVIDIAESKFITLGSKIDIKTKNEVVGTIANILAQQAPKTLRNSGITPEVLADRIEGALLKKIKAE